MRAGGYKFRDKEVGYYANNTKMTGVDVVPE